MNTPFNLNDNYSYMTWKNKRLQVYPVDTSNLFVAINESNNPSLEEVGDIKNIAHQYNFALYRFMDANYRSKESVHRLGKQLGLHRLDNNICADNDKLTSIEVRHNPGQHNYIPYSNRNLSWHTDGYYNTKAQQINGMLLHCAQPALTGGENLLMDTDIAYILLRDENPHYIKALMQPDAMTIPANILNGKIIRAEQSGPVFSINKNGGLHMRYSARKRNIIWNNDTDTQNAVSFLEDLWGSDSKYIIKHALKAGEGLVCNNILHSRTEFKDSDTEEEKRLLYRGRYYDRLDAPYSSVELHKVQGQE